WALGAAGEILPGRAGNSYRGHPRRTPGHGAGDPRCREATGSGALEQPVAHPMQLPWAGGAVMKRSPLFDFVLALLAVVGTPLAALAQASAPPPSAGGAPSAAGSGIGVAMVLALIVLLALIVAVVKLYDLKRKRDDETLAIEAPIVDAL